MHIDDIAQYTHKIKKITINNKNIYSLYNYVLLKITLDSSDVKDDETVRFSTIDGEWLEHEQFNDDFYCYIPNKINSIYDIYVHFFPSHLYQYTGDEKIFSIYDFTELYEALSSNNNIPTTIDNKTFQHQSHYFDGTKYVENENGEFDEVPEMYDIEANIKDYTTEIDDNGSLIVKAYSSDSVTKDFNPNYKQYTTIGNNNTQQGMFPLASKYRSTQDWKVPDLNDNDPQWKQQNNNPFWEVRINRIGLSPLITNKVYGKDLPINVLLNYEYLPSSREYHQHYYGFEPDWNDINDANIQIEKCNLINIFEGTNVKRLDDAFGNDNDYRIINWGNPYDDTKSFKKNFNNNIIPIELKNFQPVSCIWKENVCDHYWNLKPIDANVDLPYCYKDIELKEDVYYSLKFFIYIPERVVLETQEYNSCRISVISDKEYTIPDDFLKHDKDTRNQWIYHEVPFKAAEKNTIKIYGAPYSEEYQNDIHIINMSIEEMVKYSPTLKYTNRNLILSEQENNVSKSLSDTSTVTSSCPKITPSNKTWTSNLKKLPVPYNDINIRLENEKYVYYDKTTTNIYYTYPKYVLKDDIASRYENTVIVKNESNPTPTYEDHYYKKVNNEMQKLNNATGATYKEKVDTNTVIELKCAPQNSEDADKDIRVYHSTGQRNNTEYSELKETYSDFLSGIRGRGNKFTFYFQDANGNPPNHGDVEIGIFETNDERQDISAAKQYIIRKNINGVVTWENIDLSLKSLPYNSHIQQLILNSETVDQELEEQLNQYYVRIKYTDQCMDEGEAKIVFKTLIVTDEHFYFGNSCGSPNSITLINDPTDRTLNLNIEANSTYYVNDKEQFPIRLTTYIMSNNNSNTCLAEGWCELYIDEDLHQSTLIDNNGKADFYLNFSDVKIGKQTIKLEYYKDKYNTPLAFIYFDLNVKNILAQDAVLIDFYRQLPTSDTPQKITASTIYISQDDFIILDVAPDKNATEYNCEIFIDSEKYISQDFYGKPKEDGQDGIPIILPETKNYNIDIVTQNIKESDGSIYKDKFQTFHKTLKVVVR